ncbi:MAG: DUF1365 family protein [Thermodesulfobacteriota bacterium]|nr:DUF1365 family protein [Thermodesulfobacteriota bacterium]
MNSCIVKARLYHKRHWPVTNRFVYDIYLYAIDVNELDELDRQITGFGYNRHTLAAIHDTDYLEHTHQSVREKIRNRLTAAGLATDVDRIMLITAARYCNHIFNPVSFFYCMKKDGTIACIVAEVNNTLGEKHIYLLDTPRPGPGGDAATFHTEKRFHVSPFFPREGEYDFFFSPLADTLDICINYYRDGVLQLETRLSGICEPLTPRSFLKTVATRPVQAVMTMPRILYQAWILYVKKRLPVYHKPPPSDPHTMTKQPKGLLFRLYMRSVFGVLSVIENGGLTFHLPSGRTLTCGNAHDGNGIINLHSFAFFKKVFYGSDIGFGEAYMAGDWTSPDLPAALGVIARNLGAIDKKTSPLSGLKKMMDVATHRKRKNTVAGSRKNIHAHYDTGNAFFSKILDPTRMYSCALFETPDDDLHSAQLNKISAICKKATIKETDHVLEIGTGWGGFAIEAVARTGCTITTTTISREQYGYARQQVADRGLSGNITVLQQDYRHLTGSFDKIVSIEMLEAVGHEFYPAFFKICERLLKPGGKMVIQVITIPHERYDTYRSRVDWIQKYIFPGGLLPSVEILEQTIARHTDLHITNIASIGPHYAPTLAAWRHNLLAREDDIRKLGVDDIGLRMWEYYFAYCQAGFEAGVIDDVQMVIEK